MIRSFSNKAILERANPKVKEGRGPARAISGLGQFLVPRILNKDARNPIVNEF